MTDSRGMIRGTSCAIAALTALLLAPAIAQACAVCMGGADEDVRTAFILTTAFLTACPLLVLGGVLWWLRRTFKAAAEAEARGVVSTSTSAHLPSATGSLSS